MENAPPPGPTTTSAKMCAKICAKIGANFFVRDASGEIAKNMVFKILAQILAHFLATTGVVFGAHFGSTSAPPESGAKIWAFGRLKSGATKKGSIALCGGAHFGSTFPPLSLLSLLIGELGRLHPSSPAIGQLCIGVLRVRCVSLAGATSALSTVFERMCSMRCVPEVCWRPMSAQSVLILCIVMPSAFSVCAQPWCLARCAIGHVCEHRQRCFCFRTASAFVSWSSVAGV